MATNTGVSYSYQNNGGNPYSNPPSHHISPYYKLVAATVVTLGLIALLAKLFHFWLRSLKADDGAQAEATDAADTSEQRRRAPPSDAERGRARPVAGGGGVVARPHQQQQPPAPAAVAVEMVRAMGPLVCTYLRADGWPAEAACAVCLAELADGEALRVLPVCMHYFHSACVGEWLRAHHTCPLCRAPLAPPAAADR